MKHLKINELYRNMVYDRIFRRNFIHVVDPI